MDIKDLFYNIHSEKYNFIGLYHFIIDNDIAIEFVEFRIQALGMAAYDKVYIHKNAAFNIDDDLFFHVISHEIGHYLSFRKYGHQFHLDRLSSNDWDVFFNHVIHEEIFADKFASLLYFRLNGHIYDGLKQNLHKKERQSDYAILARENLFGVYTNDIEDYQRAVKSLILS